MFFLKWFAVGVLHCDGAKKKLEIKLLFFQVSTLEFVTSGFGLIIVAKELIWFSLRWVFIKERCSSLRSRYCNLLLDVHYKQVLFFFSCYPCHVRFSNRLFSQNINPFIFLCVNLNFGNRFQCFKHDGLTFFVILWEKSWTEMQVVKLFVELWTGIYIFSRNL